MTDWENLRQQFEAVRASQLYSQRLGIVGTTCKSSMVRMSWDIPRDSRGKELYVR